MLAWMYWKSAEDVKEMRRVCQSDLDGFGGGGPQHTKGQLHGFVNACEYFGEHHHDYDHLWASGRSVDVGRTCLGCTGQ